MIRKSTDLAIHHWTEIQEIDKIRDATVGAGDINIVQRSKQAQILACAQPRIKTAIRSAVITKLLAYPCWIPLNIRAPDPCPASGRQQQCGQHAQERGLAGAVGSHHGHDIARGHCKGHIAESRHRRWHDRMQQGAPSGKCRGKEFLQLFDAQRFSGHLRVYTGAGLPRQALRGEYQAGGQFLGRQRKGRSPGSVVQCKYAFDMDCVLDRSTLISRVLSVETEFAHVTMRFDDGRDW